MEKNTEKQKVTMKTGVVDIGGGFRGIYALSVGDYCMEHCAMPMGNILWTILNFVTIRWNFMSFPQMHERDKPSILTKAWRRHRNMPNKVRC